MTVGRDFLSVRTCGRKSLFALLLIRFTRVTDRFLLSCVRRDSFALKWFWPDERATTLPFLVILSRFRYDLFVFCAISGYFTLFSI